MAVEGMSSNCCLPRFGQGSWTPALILQHGALGILSLTSGCHHLCACVKVYAVLSALSCPACTSGHPHSPLAITLTEIRKRTTR